MPDADPVLPTIHTLRGQRAVLDADLARLYGVPTKVFNQAIRRNAGRTAVNEGVTANWSQFVTSSYRGAIYRPWVFTEHGAIMAAMLLRSDRAIAVSVFVVRAFVRMREELATSGVILKRLAEIDGQLLEHDTMLRDIYERLLPLLQPPPDTPRPAIGFHPR